MEQQPHQPNGGEHQPEYPAVNSYGTDNPEEQARIEQARIDASEERRRDRANLEHLVELGMRPDDAEAFIEFEHYVQGRVAERCNPPIEPHDSNQALPRGVDTPSRTEQHDSIETDAGEPTEQTPRYHPRIYVADLASYNSGILHRLWIDANQSADELDADIAAMLDSSPTIRAEEWAIHDVEGFAGIELGEHTDTVTVSQLARGVAEHGAAFAAYATLTRDDRETTFEQFENFYVGSYDSPAAWARAVGDDLEWNAQLDRVVDPMLRPYLTIDYARFAQDASSSWDVVKGSDGKTHVFFR